MHIPLGEDRLDRWYTQFDPKTDVRIALVGKYPHKDAYISILHQLRYHGVNHVEYRSSPKDLDSFDGIIIPGGWGQRGTEELIATAKFARVNRVPCLGICLGLQIMLIEYARNVLGLENANSMEFDPNTPYPVVSLQENQKSLDSMGATSRLGNWTTTLDETSTTARLFQASEITQRHRHRYEINPAFEYRDFKVVGRDKKTGLIEIMELPSHPFYIGVQCHPEFGTEKNPLFRGLIEAAQRRQHSSARTTPSLLSHIVEGTAGTGLISIDIEDRSALDRIAALSAAELHEEGISEKQQIIVRKILALMDERDHALSKIECSIDAYELQMREINIAASPVYEGSGLSNSDRERLAELDRLIEVCKSQIRDGREHYENEVSSLDLEMRATMSLAATEEDLAG
jgi:CTP synthase